jgi:D-alanyl-D-alanine carboxypeptidase
MKTSLRKFFNLNYFFPVLIISLLPFLIQSCKKDATSPTEPQKKILTAENIVKLQAAADKIMRDKVVPGMIVYIGVEGEGELNITRGVANLVTSEPMNINNYFRLASVTKTFTTETALILVDEGKIDLNKTISYYLPEYPTLPGKDNITVRMLGNMTSGFIDALDDSALGAAYYGSQGTVKFTPEQLIVPLLTSHLIFTPGTQYKYCNSNTIILGLIIKKVTGQDLKDVLAAKIFQPLRMTHTLWPETNFLPTPYSHAYTSKLGVVNQDVTYWGNSWGNAAGILISNIADLKIWVKELYERKLLSSNTKNERFQFGVPDAGYGFGVERFMDWAGHSGGIAGWNNMVFYQGVKKISVIISCNSLDDVPASAAFPAFGQILDPQ